MVERVSVPAEEGISNTPKADNTENKETGNLILGKFKDQSALEKAYQELEKQNTKLSQSKAEGTEQKPTFTGKPDAKTEMFDKTEDTEEKPEETDENKPATLEDVKSVLPGFSEEEILEFSNHAWENGKLSDEQYAALDKRGYSRDLVDQYIQGQFALVETQRTSLINAGGGEQAVEAMFGWAAEHLDPKEVETYNAKFDAGGSDALMAMEHLRARFQESGHGFGFNGGRVGGANTPSGDTSVYTSTAQVTKDMQSAEYKSDPAFRKKVADKIARSNVL